MPVLVILVNLASYGSSSRGVVSGYGTRVTTLSSVRGGTSFSGFLRARPGYLESFAITVAGSSVCTRRSLLRTVPRVFGAICRALGGRRGMVLTSYLGRPASGTILLGKVCVLGLPCYAGISRLRRVAQGLGGIALSVISGNALAPFRVCVIRANGS